MGATSILQRPAQFQWDADSSPCKSSNCGPTVYAMIAGFYKDKHISPTAMRRAMIGSNACGGTTAIQGARGMRAFGVSAGYGVLTSVQAKQKVIAGIPVAISVIYGMIPSGYKQDKTFRGSHVVLLCQATSRNGVPGMLVRDPDRWGTGKVSYAFWPDKVWVPAFNATKNTAAYPLSKKR